MDDKYWILQQFKFIRKIYILIIKNNTNTNNKISIAQKSGAKTCNQRRLVA